MARSATHARNRKIVLAQSTVCWLCGHEGADSADHVVPLSRGGTDEVSNLRPAHLSCNMRRGNRMQTHRRMQGVSDVELRHPGPLPDPTHGVVLPRLETAYTCDGSYVEQVSEWAEKHMDGPLHPWQEVGLGGVLAHRDGRLVHRNSLLSTARQNGKTYSAVALMGWWLDEGWRLFDDRKGLAILVSHDLRLSKEMFNAVLFRLEMAGALGKCSLSFGRQELTSTSGARLAVHSDSASAGHGFARVGLLYGDEVWHMGEDAWEQGLIPTTRTHPQPIILATSTAGDDSSKLLRRWRERGLRLVDTRKETSFYFAEWSPPAGVDFMDERWWGYANPTLGGDLSIDVLRAESESPNRASFLRSSLNLWVASDTSWIKPGTWEALQAEELPEPKGGVLVCEVSLEGSRWVGVRCWPNGDKVAVRTEFVVETSVELWEQVAKVLEDPTVTLAVTPSLEYQCPDRYQRRTRVVTWAELNRWTIGVRSLLDQGKVAHLGDLMMAEHVNRAVLVRTETGQAISGKRSPGPIELCQCMVWGVAMLLKPAVQGKPSMGRAR